MTFVPLSRPPVDDEIKRAVLAAIDSRSSDAIAVAVRAHAPIYAADDVIEESAIEMEGDEVNEEEIVDEFKKFLDKVSAEDFLAAEVEDVEEAEVEDDDD